MKSYYDRLAAGDTQHRNFLNYINDENTVVDSSGSVEPHGGGMGPGCSSRDGSYWSRAGTWTHKPGTGARIGLVFQSGAGFVANFDYVRVYELKD
ncbi:hypothetical protein [Corallococcus sicarius]|uniref:Uncharacterized protein n=1 Tax=Corallococcus sicarius TaxID=2316726 RepID=A0A3A8NE58_9BACT|nr:hypothetical protein [Corallococcus sicarius]RKH42283.1 hypothetical protein D7X12_16190 [Corallococcus sicarius]